MCSHRLSVEGVPPGVHGVYTEPAYKPPYTEYAGDHQCHRLVIVLVLSGTAVRPH